MRPTTVQSTWRAQIAHADPSSSYERTPDAASTMVSPAVVSSAATATTRWNDVMGRPSHAPKRVRGPLGADALSSAGVSCVSLGDPARRNRVRIFLTADYRIAACTAAANASPRLA